MKFTFTFITWLLFAMSSFAQVITVANTQNFSYCYENYEYTSLIYQSNNGSPLSINFTSGSFEEDYDLITIIDGNGSGTVLLDEYSGSLSGLNFIAQSGFITILIDTDGSFSCADEDQETLEYTISVMSCTVPTYNITWDGDCQNSAANTGSVTFNVTNMGNNTSFTIGTGNQVQTVNAVGNYTFNNIARNVSVPFQLNIASDCIITRSVKIECITVNTSCQDAQTIAVGNSPSSNLMIIDNTNGGPNTGNCGGNTGVWVKFTVPANITSVFVRQFEVYTADALEDGFVAAYSGSCNNLVEISCNDDYENEDDWSDYSLFPYFEITNLVAGQEVYLFVTGYLSDVGRSELAVWNSAVLSTPDYSVTNQLTLYPNPVSDVLTIQSDLDVTNFEIYNVLGQQVISGKDATQINVSNLKQGTYLIKVTTSKGIETKKFIKK